MKKLFIGFLVMAFAATVCSAEVFKIIDIDNTEGTVLAVEKKTGEKLYEATSWGDIVKDGNTTYVRKFEKGAGIKKGGYRSWLTEAVYVREGNRMIPYSGKGIFKDKDGKVIETVNTTYDRASSKVSVTTNGETKTFDFPDDMINNAALGTCIRNFPFEEGRDVKFTLLASGPQVFKITMKNLGKETVITHDGKQIECYKLQMVPDLGALALVGAFIPKTYFWYEAASPHRFVRYEGLDGGLGTPYMVYEVSSYADFDVKE
ncbi:MAG: hypothetical protein ABIJ26_04390 [Candidatus Margulisiibacteriota bacterium]